MKKSILLVLITVCLNSFSQEYPFEEKIYGMTLQQMDILINNEGSGYYYDDLINKFYEGDGVMTKKEMILTYYGFAILPGYKPYLWLDLENSIIKSNNEFQYEKAKELADSLVGMIPVSTMANEELSFALGKTKDTLGAAFYRNQYDQLIEVISNSGDGKSKETAYMVIGMKDISVITQINRMQVTKQKRIKKNNHVYEVLTVYHKHEKKKVYFDITLIETYGLKAIQKEKKKK